VCNNSRNQKLCNKKALCALTKFPKISNSAQTLLKWDFKFPHTDPKVSVLASSSKFAQILLQKGIKYGSCSIYEELGMADVWGRIKMGNIVEKVAPY
jgi:hypothetical protein